ncbi:hypothetical protein [Candidatus Odyssella thessalonicensis]|uniref:hypothetical protein n=1 Tax=Candidatus Odyssella thessalonicensis TaxID=84647 RepID=UPI000225B72D|nr:hypothetical protein [Candidatus Odyssella thessalonicensis]
MTRIKLFLTALCLAKTVANVTACDDHDCRDCREVIMPSVHGSTGKWLDPKVPHRGWECDEVEDLGEASKLCEMCERETIRYVHYMSHPTHESLEVGCICAGHMEGDLEAAKCRDRDLKSRLSRRANWLSLAGWKISRNGNDYIHTRPNGTDSYSHHVVITCSRFGYYSFMVDGSFGKKWFPSPDKAKLAAFDYLWPPRISID